MLWLYIVLFGTLQAVAWKFPRIRNVVSVNAVAIAGISLAIGLGYCLDSVFGLGVRGAVAMYLAIAAVYLLVKTRLWLDVPEVVWKFISVGVQYVLRQGLLPVLAIVVVWFWQIAKRIVHIPRILGGTLEHLGEWEEKLRNTPGWGEGFATKILIDAEGKEERRNQAEAEGHQ
ncbi:hypothetical protein DFR70_1011122 [Nocardia tenerifensis]|uniref:Uncharacterized protein n=1 Tax=Nocardia tenerifensis TaxID=228006 RepID=A0A318KBJ3_9NOCA|nr:hypothetical protein [Nocardia tenerifensis]PXX71688.1 hypothetical protein DFR70_1011122 [Nocardia tenerifensis]